VKIRIILLVFCTTSGFLWFNVLSLRFIASIVETTIRYFNFLFSN